MNVVDRASDDIIVNENIPITEEKGNLFRTRSLVKNLAQI